MPSTKITGFDMEVRSGKPMQLIGGSFTVKPSTSIEETTVLDLTGKGKLCVAVMGSGSSAIATTLLGGVCLKIIVDDKVLYNMRLIPTSSGGSSGIIGVVASKYILGTNAPNIAIPLYRTVDASGNTLFSGLGGVMLPFDKILSVRESSDVVDYYIRSTNGALGILDSEIIFNKNLKVIASTEQNSHTSDIVAEYSIGYIKY